MKKINLRSRYDPGFHATDGKLVPDVQDDEQEGANVSRQKVRDIPLRRKKDVEPIQESDYCEEDNAKVGAWSAANRDIG